MKYKIKKNKIEFSQNFDDPLSEDIIEDIKKCEIIYFNYDFNQPVNNLPNNIRKIIFGKKFNQPVDHLPQEIMMINFCCDFNQTIDFLPINLICLSLGPKFNQPIDNLPENLKKLTIHNFSNELNVKNFHSDRLNINDAPGKFNQKIDNLPINLKALYILTGYFNQSIDNLPKSLEILELGQKFNYPVDNLPKSLKYLTLGLDFNHPVDNLPENLKELCLSREFNHKLRNLPNIKVLYIFHKFSHSLNRLTDSIEVLNIGVQKMMNGWWGHSGKNFYFRKMFKKIPANLKIMRINSMYPHSERLKEILGDKLEIVDHLGY